MRADPKIAEMMARADQAQARSKELQAEAEAAQAAAKAAIAHGMALVEAPDPAEVPDGVGESLTS